MTSKSYFANLKEQSRSSFGYSVRAATESDVDFLARAVQDSERAHTGVGIWDVAIGDDNASDSRSLLSVLRHACLNDNQSHFHYSNFKVIVANPHHDTSTAKNLVSQQSSGEEIVGAGCCFRYPEFSVSKSYPGVSLATRSQRPEVGVEESVRMWDKINIFIDKIFPSYNYDNTWMLESIYIAEGHRKAGLALGLIHSLFEEGRECPAKPKECLLASAIGNAAAYRSYTRAGFTCVGEGRDDEAEAVLGYPGFHLFKKTYDINSSEI
jgi:GNAT superfamily N-acetyltransferase